MKKILLSHTQLIQDKLKTRAELHFTKMDQNETYAEFQPVITTLKTLIENYTTAVALADQGGKDRTKAKNDAKNAIVLHLTKLARLVEIKVNELPEEEVAVFVENSGFDMQSKRVKKVVDYLDAPTGFTLTNDPRHGVVNGEWERVEGAKMYALENLDHEGNWPNGKYTNEMPLIMTGLVRGSKLTMRLKAMAANGVVSDYCEPVTVYVD